MVEHQGSIPPQEVIERLQLNKCIIALVGLPLVGKTTLGQELARRSNLALLDVNDARWEIFHTMERLQDESWE